MPDVSAERAAELDAAGMGFFYAASIAPEISIEAARMRCVDHPTDESHAGFGYAGGGFGPYRRCNTCHVVFAKKAAPDGNDGDRHAILAASLR